MALDYRKCAEQIVSHIGGRENIVQAAHCATRLRLVIKDNGNVLTLTVTATQNGQVATAVTTCTFDGSSDEALCIKAEQVATFPSEAMAKQSWEVDYDEEDKASGEYKLSGNKIIQDLTEQFEGATKLEVKLALEYAKAQIENGSLDEF